MANIDSIAFNKELRPSTVAALNKINELVKAVNDLDPASIASLKSDFETVKSNVSTLQSQMVTANSNIATNTNNVAELTTDMDKVKVTLYTPLKTDE